MMYNKRKYKPSILKEVDYLIFNLIIHKLRVYVNLKISGTPNWCIKKDCQTDRVFIIHILG